MATTTPVNGNGGHDPPQASCWQRWNMSFGFLGMQFGFALQNANVSCIFETLGVEVESIPPSSASFRYHIPCRAKLALGSSVLPAYLLR